MPVARSSPAEVFVFGPFLVLPARRTLLRNGQEVRLGRRAFDLLLALVTRAGEIVDKPWLAAQVWPEHHVDESTLRAHVAGLRKTLGDTGGVPCFIASVPSRGYCFVADVTHFATPAPPSHPTQGAWRGGLARLIGRDAALAAIAAALPGRRLVTIAGPGGVGKTSVAAAVATRMAPRFEHGVRLIDLANVTHDESVMDAAATALGLPLGGGSDASELTARLSHRSALLVVDNCEHVRDAAARLVQALLLAPRIHVLATSRQALGVANEHVERLAPLPTPPANARLALAEAMLFPAFELFVERATASFDEIHLGDADSADIADLCRRLDGIPLAIELVAAQIGFYGLAGLRTMLADTGSLSALGRRTAQPRHRSLRSLFDWSFGLLLPQEQQLLCQLSVFQARFTLVEALRIAGGRAGDVADALNGLVEKSLLNAQQHAPVTRYWLLETTRSYAADRLAADEGREVIARRHATHCIELARNAALDATRHTASQATDAASPVADIRAALAWALEGGDVVLGAHLALQSAALYAARRLRSEHAHNLECALARLASNPAHEPLRLQLLIEWGQACRTRGAAEQALSVWSAARDLAHRLGDSTAELDALNGVFDAQCLVGSHAEAMAAGQRYASVARALGDAAALRVADRLMGFATHLAGDHAQAMTHMNRAWAPGPEAASQERVDPALCNHQSQMFLLKARLMWASGLPDQAATAAQAAVTQAQDGGLVDSEARALALAACPIAIWRGDAASARLFVDALDDLAREHGLSAWHPWAQWYRVALARLRMTDDTPTPRSPASPALAALLATFHEDFDNDASWLTPAVVERDWLAAERMRRAGERMAAAGHFERAHAWLSDAFATATAQGSHAWALRSAYSLARLQAPTHPLQARALLAQVLDCCKEGLDTPDAQAAAALAQRLDTVASHNSEFVDRGFAPFLQLE